MRPDATNTSDDAQSSCFEIKHAALHRLPSRNQQPPFNENESPGREQNKDLTAPDVH